MPRSQRIVSTEAERDTSDSVDEGCRGACRGGTVLGAGNYLGADGTGCSCSRIEVIEDELEFVAGGGAGSVKNPGDSGGGNIGGGAAQGRCIIGSAKRVIGVDRGGSAGHAGSGDSRRGGGHQRVEVIAGKGRGGSQRDIPLRGISGGDGRRLGCAGAGQVCGDAVRHIERISGGFGNLTRKNGDQQHHNGN